jgi:hypothetical protein
MKQNLDLFIKKLIFKFDEILFGEIDNVFSIFQESEDKFNKRSNLNRSGGFSMKNLTQITKETEND